MSRCAHYRFVSCKLVLAFINDNITVTQDPEQDGGRATLNPTHLSGELVHHSEPFFSGGGSSEGRVCASESPGHRVPYEACTEPSSLAFPPQMPDRQGCGTSSEQARETLGISISGIKPLLCSSEGLRAWLNRAAAERMGQGADVATFGDQQCLSLETGASHDLFLTPSDEEDDNY